MKGYKERNEMKDFPDFMKKPENLIDKKSQYTDGIEGYVYNGEPAASSLPGIFGDQMTQNVRLQVLVSA